MNSLRLTPLRHQQQQRRELTAVRVMKILVAQDCTPDEAKQVLRALKGGGGEEGVSLSLAEIVKSDQFRTALMRRRRTRQKNQLDLDVENYS